MAVLGTRLYLVANGNIVYRASSGSYTNYNTDQTYDKIWSIKGRIVASDTSGVLYDVSGGTDSAIKTLPTGRTWTDMCDAGAVALATATDGYIYSFC